MSKESLSEEDREIARVIEIGKRIPPGAEVPIPSPNDAELLEKEGIVPLSEGNADLLRSPTIDEERTKTDTDYDGSPQN